jgi:hypothetical protein
MSRKEGEKMDYPIIDWEKQKQKKGDLWWK